jgi:hypothetical protein
VAAVATLVAAGVAAVATLVATCAAVTPSAAVVATAVAGTSLDDGSLDGARVADDAVTAAGSPVHAASTTTSASEDMAKHFLTAFSR